MRPCRSSGSTSSSSSARPDGRAGTHPALKDRACVPNPVKDGEFSSFWPPDYRATYVVRWIVEDGAVTGLSFTQSERGERFDGLYE
jgi:hypothetical protein